MDPENQETIDEQTGAEDQSTDMVEIHQASIDDLDEALASAQAQEQDAPPVEDSAASDEEAPQSDNAQQPNGQADSPESPGEEGIATQGSNASKPEKKVYTQEEVQALIDENQRNKQKGDQKELFIQHRSNELGTVRRELAAARNQLATIRKGLADGLGDRYHEDPVKANEDRDKIKDIDAEIAALNEKEAQAIRIVESQTLFLRHVDTHKVSVDDVAEVLRGEGVPENHIAAFKESPWTFTTPEALVQMGKRAMDRVEFKQADDDRRVLAKHVLYLNEEIKKLKGKPGQVLRQVQKHLNQPRSITPASSSNPKTVRDLDPTRMTTAQLDEALKGTTVQQ